MVKKDAVRTKLRKFWYANLTKLVFIFFLTISCGVYWCYNERMGKIEGGEERFFKIKFSPIHKIYIRYRHINLIIFLRKKI